MIFSSNSIENILSGKKTQHRMLVKEGDISQCFPNNDFSIIKILEIFRNKKSIWCVGKSYAVQAGRGKKGKGLWYCPKCKKLVNRDEDTWEFSKKRNLYKPIKMPYTHCGGEIIHDEFFKIKKYKECGTELKPLRIKITGIKKERLLDISEEDARREGYRSKADYLHSFCLINNINPKLLVNNNPEVWVLSFCLESDLYDLSGM